jgi:hypothetical protein
MDIAPETSPDSPASGACATPILIPMIDFGSPTGDAMVEVRKGFGLSEVGASTPSP